MRRRGRRRGRRGKRGRERREREREEREFFSFVLAPHSHHLPTFHFFCQTFSSAFVLLFSSAFHQAPRDFLRFHFFCRRREEEERRGERRRVFVFLSTRSSLTQHARLLLSRLSSSFFLFLSTSQCRPRSLPAPPRCAPRAPSRPVALPPSSFALRRCVVVEEKRGSCLARVGVKSSLLFFRERSKKKKKETQAKRNRKASGGSDQLGELPSLSPLQ